MGNSVEKSPKNADHSSKEKEIVPEKEFYYYFHATSITDPSIINDILDNGLINERGTSLYSTAWPMGLLKKEELGEKMKEYSKSTGKGSTVFVIRIPKYYLFPKLSEDGRLTQLPLPIWKQLPQRGYYDRVRCQLSPTLIYGVYFGTNDSFRRNPNYSPVHNPEGLQFDDMQLDHLLNNGVMSWYDFASSRNEKSFAELAQQDIANHNWDNALTQYRRHFNIETDVAAKSTAKKFDVVGRVSAWLKKQG